MVVLAKAAIVVAGVYFNVKSLPARDPTKPLNEARYCVVDIEATVLAKNITMLLVSILRVCWSWCTGGQRGPAEITAAVEVIAEWSSLKLLLLLNSAEVFKRATMSIEFAEAAQKPVVGYYNACVSVGSALIQGVADIAALAVRIAQVSFVTDTLWWNYSLSEVFLLLSFAVNVIGIYDAGDIEMLAVQRFLTQDLEHSLGGAKQPGALWEVWKMIFSEEVQRIFGAVSSFVISSTLDVNDLRKLLVHQDKSRPPQLYTNTIAKCVKLGTPSQIDDTLEPLQPPPEVATQGDDDMTPLHPEERELKVMHVSKTDLLLAGLGERDMHKRAGHLHLLDKSLL